MSQHSPAPWHAEVMQGSRVMTISAGINDEGDGPAEYVCSFSVAPSPADAALMIAAPELLEALRAWVDADVWSRCTQGNLCKCETHRLTRAAIARAEGRQP